MCKYCTDNFKNRKNYIIDYSNNINYDYLDLGLVKFEINPGNFIMVEIADLTRENENGEKPAHIAIMANPPFDYCPFCGRKLNESI